MTSAGKLFQTLAAATETEKNGRQWWNGALLERQVLLLMRIGDAIVLACLTHDAVHQPGKMALSHTNANWVTGGWLSITNAPKCEVIYILDLRL